MTAAPAAVTFDFWNTLVFEERGHLRGRRLDAWAGILEEAGFAVERARLHAVFDIAWDAYVESWRSNQQYLAVQAAEHVIERLGFHVPAAVRDDLVDAFSHAGADADLHLAEGAAEALGTLAEAGVRLGIICDVGWTPSHVLRRHLDRLGVLELFHHVSFSDEVGVYKPSPLIFEHALTGLGVRPHQTVHVGDLRRTDVAGARAMNMTAVRYTGIFDDDSQSQPEGHHVVVAHADVPVVLGL